MNNGGTVFWAVLLWLLTVGAMTTAQVLWVAARDLARACRRRTTP